MRSKARNTISISNGCSRTILTVGSVLRCPATVRPSAFRERGTRCVAHRSAPTSSVHWVHTVWNMLIGMSFDVHPKTRNTQRSIVSSRCSPILILASTAGPCLGIGGYRLGGSLAGHAGVSRRKIGDVVPQAIASNQRAIANLPLTYPLILYKGRSDNYLLKLV